MGCDEPLTGYYSTEFGRSGKRLITFNRLQAFSPSPIKLPCQQCIGCRLERSRQWAIRCMHEKRLHNANEFLTLTYSNDYLCWAIKSRRPTLVREHPQLFMKRLRKRYGEGIRFYGCGEYGKETARPHYHFILFNHMFDDRKFLYTSKNGDDYYTSDKCRDLWSYGNNILGDVTFESCAYVAAYVTDKITGDPAADHYDGRLPEFPMMSRRPGIGSGWFDKYGEHAYKFDSVIMRGREMRPPRFYDTRFDTIDTVQMSRIKKKRRSKALAQRHDNTSARRHVKEEVLRLSLRKREFR